jgi:hypothetical protein
VVSGGVQRLLAESAGMRRKSEVEHEGERLGGAGRGGIADYRPVLVGQPGRQVWVAGEQPHGRLAVASKARAEEPVYVGAVLGGAARSQPRRGLLLTSSHGQAQRGHSVTVTGPRVRSGVKQGCDHGERGGGGGVRKRLGCRVRRPTPVGRQGAEQERGRAGMVVEDSGAHRPGPGDPGAVGQQQPQAPPIAVSGGLGDGLAQVGLRPGIQQHRSDLRVVHLDRPL